MFLNIRHYGVRYIFWSIVIFEPILGCLKTLLKPLMKLNWPKLVTCSLAQKI